MGIRNDILANLATRIDTQVGSLVTVKRSVKDPVEIKKYKQADLPALFIPEANDESYNYTGSRHSMNEFDVVATLYFIQWDPDGTAPVDFNAYLDPILIAIHSDITNGSKSVNTSVTSINRLTQTYPLYSWLIRIKFQYNIDYTTR